MARYPLLAGLVLVAVVATDAFQPAAVVGVGSRRAAVSSRGARVSSSSLHMTGGLDDLRIKLKSIELEGMRSDLLNLCDKTQRGVTSPEDSEDRKLIMELVEKLEKVNPEPKPLSSDLINGNWRLRWTTSQSILGRNRMRGFRVDLERPIFQEIDAVKLTARNVEPITSFRWLFGGLKYTNNVQAVLTPMNDSKVMVQFKKFNLFGGLISITAPEKAKGELDTTYLDNGIVCDVDGSRGECIRISRGDRGNVFVLTKST